MKKRICFVDEEPQALDSLRQSMSGLGNSWDCAYALSGEEALNLLAGTPFDAIVTNIRLPGIDGVELLREVGRAQPATLRFILGDVADQGVVVNCLGGTHQFIPRPCPAEALASIVQRSLALDAWLASEELHKLVPRLKRLPSLPSTYFELLMQIESPHAGAELIAEVIARDPAATARLLQVVNSAAFALRRKITDTADAVALLGVETVKSIVLCVQVFDPHEHAMQAGFSFDALWTHSLSVATISRNLMTRLTQDSRAANEAFTAGLLHDVGRIVLASNLPDEYAAIISAAKQNQTPLEQEEEAQLGVNHAQVGAYLLGLWGMPAHLVEATALHHTPDHKLSREFSVLTAVHVANVLAHHTEEANKEANPNELSKPQLNVRYLTALNLPASVEDWQSELEGHPVHRMEEPAEPKSEKANESRGFEREEHTHNPAQANWLLRLVIPVAAVVLVVVWFSLKGKILPSLQVHARPVSEQKVPVVKHPPALIPAGTSIRQQSVNPGTQLSGAAEKTPLSNSTPLSESKAPTSGPTEPKKESEAAKTPDEEATSGDMTNKGFDSIKVQAIFYRPDNPRVMINGNLYGRGDRVNGVQILSIANTGVTLSSNGEERVFRIE